MMRGFDRSCWFRMHLAAALLAALGSAGTCWSQVTVGEEEEVENNAVLQPAQAVFMMTDDQFDQWVFGGPRNSRAGRNKLDSLLTLQVDDVARMCTLSEAQKKKLLLAGRGDIKRFFDQVEEKRKKFGKVKNDKTKFNEIYQELVPLQAALNSGLFGAGSIYSKTIRRVLSEEEDARYQRVIQDKNRFRYRAKIELVVAQLDQSVGLRDEQRRKLVELIMSETQLPTRFGQYDYYLVMYQAGQVAEAKLKPLFEDRQWALLNRQLNQMRGMEQFLRNQGLLPPLKVVHPPRRRAVAGELPAEVFAAPADVEKKGLFRFLVRASRDLWAFLLGEGRFPRHSHLSPEDPELPALGPAGPLRRVVLPLAHGDTRIRWCGPVPELTLDLVRTALRIAASCVPADAVDAARQAGHDLARVREFMPGADDDRVLAQSIAEQRVLLTFDKDVGELAFRQGKKSTHGVILLRPKLKSPAYVSRFLVTVLAQTIDWEGHFCVAREGRPRTIPLPA